MKISSSTPAPRPADEPMPAPTKIPEVPDPVGPPGLGGVEDTLIARVAGEIDLSAERAMARGPERKAAVWNRLVEHAENTQKPVISALEDLKSQGLVTGFERMFLPNALIIQAASGKASSVMDALKGVAEISEVTQNSLWSVVDGGGRTQVANDPATAASEPEWGVAKIGAPKAWKNGVDGKGITIGIVDTGLDAAHPAIRDRYRGTNSGGEQTHDHNWFDPINGRPQPYDDQGHGTHVGGTSAGLAPDRIIGVAPGANLIAAKAINSRGLNTTVATLKALQFMLAPTDVTGQNPDPTRGADVINNSWGNSSQKDETFRESFSVLQDAGIEVVTAAGNNGPRGKVGSPASLGIGIGVAATTPSDTVASFSSRGPSDVVPGRFVPNLAAPGTRVVSAAPGGGYQSSQGTSMASPHVAGAVALILSAHPQASHEKIVEALEKTATDIDAAGPDHSSGWGRINVDSAIGWLTLADPKTADVDAVKATRLMMGPLFRNLESPEASQAA